MNELLLRAFNPAVSISLRQYLPAWKLMTKYSGFRMYVTYSRLFTGINPEYLVMAMYVGILKKI